MRKISFGLLILLRLSAAQAATLPNSAHPDATRCQSAIDTVERHASVPPKLLSAIARTESGRAIESGRVVAWPWTINVAGIGYFFETIEAAISAVETFRTANVRSIDVGCMQVNLMYHPDAFASLRQAFEPSVNASYAAKFLTALRAELGSWPKAIAAYHSRTPDLAAAYGQRIMQAWPLAASYGGSATPVRRTQLAMIDPYRVYTPEFARQLTLDAAARATRDRHR